MLSVTIPYIFTARNTRLLADGNPSRIRIYLRFLLLFGQAVGPESLAISYFSRSGDVYRAAFSLY